MALENEINGRVEQRMARTEKGRDGRAAHFVLLEAGPLIAFQNWFGPADLTIALADRSRNTSNLEARGFAPMNLPTEMTERLNEEALYIVGLKPAGFGSLHLLSDLGDLCCRHVILHQG